MIKKGKIFSRYFLIPFYHRNNHQKVKLRVIYYINVTSYRKSLKIKFCSPKFSNVFKFAMPFANTNHCSIISISNVNKYL